jgi:hypothetical protein
LEGDVGAHHTTDGPRPPPADIADFVDNLVGVLGNTVAKDINGGSYFMRFSDKQDMLPLRFVASKYLIKVIAM